MSYNEKLKLWHKVRPNKVAGKGYIEKPGQVENIVWQTRSAEPTPYEYELAEALVVAFGKGAEELSDVVKSLNEQGQLSPTGEEWTEESFKVEFERLGA